MITKKTQYTTSDGKQFEDGDDAVCHERIIVLDKFFKDANCKIQKGVIEVLASDFEELLDELYNNKILPPKYGQRGDF